MAQSAQSETSELDIQQSQHDAEKHSRSWIMSAGLLIGPILLSCVWFWSNDSVVVRKAGMGIFYIGSIVFALAFVRFSHHNNKIKIFKQMDSVMIRGVLGPVKKEYRANYEFESFNRLDFHHYKRMHQWGGLCVISFFFIV